MVDIPSQNSGPTPNRVVRSFWHGQFSPYEAPCLSIFVAAKGIFTGLTAASNSVFGLTRRANHRHRFIIAEFVARAGNRPRAF
jgi:hypothetical protein